MTPTKGSILAGGIAGPEYTGSIIWWALSDALIPEVALRAKWMAEGLPDALLPGARSPHRNLSDAVRAALIGRDEFVVGWIQSAGPFGDTSRVAILRRSIDPVNETVTDVQECLLTLTTTTVTSTDGTKERQATTHVSTPHPMAEKILAEWKRLQGSFTASEIRRAITSLMRHLAAVSLRDSGGVYFVPAPHTETALALARVVNSIGNSSFDILPVHHTEIGDAALARAAARSVSDEIADLQKEVAEFVAEAPRAGVLQRRLQAYDDLRNRVRLYKDLLGLEAADLDASIGKLESAVDVLLATPAAPASVSVPA